MIFIGQVMKFIILIIFTIIGCVLVHYTYSRFAPDYLTMKYTMHRMHACSTIYDSHSDLDSAYCTKILCLH